MPDIVAMDQTTKSLKSGLHRKSGHNLAGSVVQGDKLFIHPQEVFGVSLQNWGNYCYYYLLYNIYCLKYHLMLQIKGGG